jgi:hypothetical protein
MQATVGSELSHGPLCAFIKGVVIGEMLMVMSRASSPEYPRFSRGPWHRCSRISRLYTPIVERLGPAEDMLNQDVHMILLLPVPGY